MPTIQDEIKDLAKKLITDALDIYESGKELRPVIHMIFKDTKKTLTTNLDMFSGQERDNPDTANFMKGIVKDVKSKLGAIVVIVPAYMSYLDRTIRNPRLAIMEAERNKQEIILVYFENNNEIKMRIIQVSNKKITDMGEWDTSSSHWGGLFWNLGLYQSESLSMMYS